MPVELMSARPLRAVLLFGFLIVVFSASVTTTLGLEPLLLSPALRGERGVVPPLTPERK